MKFKGKWLCSKDCELCQGKALVFSGLEGFVNRDLEQDVRDSYEPCVNAEWEEPEFDKYKGRYNE